MIDFIVCDEHDSALAEGFTDYDTALESARRWAKRKDATVYLSLRTGGGVWHVEPSGDWDGPVRPHHRDSEERFSTIDDLTMSTCERFGVDSPKDRKRVEGCARAALPMIRYEDFVMHEEFLRTVWADCGYGEWPF